MKDTINATLNHIHAVMSITISVLYSILCVVESSLAEGIGEAQIRGKGFFYLRNIRVEVSRYEQIGYVRKRLLFAGFEKII